MIERTDHEGITTLRLAHGKASALDLELDPLAGEGLPIDRERPVRAGSAAQQVGTDGDTGFDRAAGPADPGQLVLVLGPAPFVEGTAVLGIYWLTLYWMYQRKLFLKI